MNARDQAHEMFEQLAVGHALSALEPEDEQAFTDHLYGCAACARALAEHGETLSHLAYGTAEVELPPSLLEGIRAGVTESGRAGSFPAPVAPLSLQAARERRRHRTVRATTALVGAAASIVMVAALVFVNRGLQSDNTQLQAADRNLSGAVENLLKDGARRVDLTGAGGSHAVAVVHNGSVSLVMQGLAANDSAKSVYVLWERSRFGVVRPVGTFDVKSDDLVVVNGLRLPGEPGSLKSFIVTHEKGRSAPRIASGPTVVTGDA